MSASIEHVMRAILGDDDEMDRRLAQWAREVERRWRELSDGDRLRLMAMCCPRCGALLEKGVAHRRPREQPCCEVKP